MDKNGFIEINNTKIHIRDLFFEIFEMGRTSHKCFEDKGSLQTLFDIWLKEKLNAGK